MRTRLRVGRKPSSRGTRVRNCAAFAAFTMVVMRTSVRAPTGRGGPSDRLGMPRPTAPLRRSRGDRADGGAAAAYPGAHGRLLGGGVLVAAADRRGQRHLLLRPAQHHPRRPHRAREYARIEAEERARRGLPPPRAPRSAPRRSLIGSTRALRWAHAAEAAKETRVITHHVRRDVVAACSSSSSTSSIRIAAIIIVPRNRRPTAAMAWLLAIYFIPLIGVFLFLLIGNPRLPRKRRRKQERINDYIHDTSEHLDFGTLRPHAPEWFTSLVTLNRNLGAMPLAGDNAAHLIPDYQQSLDAMADAIRAADALRARRVLHPPDGCRDRQPVPRARRGVRARRHRAGAARPLGEPRQAVLPQDAEAPRRDGRAVAPLPLAPTQQDQPERSRRHTT